MLKNPIFDFGTSTNGVGFFQQVITIGIGLAFIIGILIFFIMLILAAIALMSSGGDKANVESAKARMRNAMIGIVVLFSIYAIVQLFEIFFGISILSIDITNLFINNAPTGCPPPPAPC